jgi:branched-chain amino acid transport system substrate-binding protein
MARKSRLFAMLLAGAALAPLPSLAAEHTIALIKALTGPLAFVGVPEANAVKQAVEELNAANYLGNGETLKLLVNDEQNDRAQLMTLMNRAAKLDNALVILGPANTVLAIAVAPVLNDLQIPSFFTAQTAAPLPVSKWYLKITVDPKGAVTPLAKYADEKLDFKRLAIVYGRDNEGHTNNMRTFRDYLAEKGKKPVIEETIVITDTDFSAVATKVAAANPDAVWIGANAAQAGNLVLQLKQAGLKADAALFGTSGLGADYIKAGGKAVDNTYFSTDYNDQSTAPLNVKFVENYKKRYNVEPDNWSAVGYSETLVAAKAIKDALPNPTREKVLENITKMKDFETLLGDGKWGVGADRIPTYVPAIMVIRNGKPVPAPR